MQPTVFRLYAHCIPVRGARRSTLCDLQRGEYRLIPNALFDILTEHRDRTRDEIAAHYGEGSGPVIDEYFAFLEQGQLGWWCGEPERFPEMDLSWDVPARITNAIVDVGPWSTHDYAGLFAQLDDLGCRALQLRFFSPRTLDEVEEVVAATDQGRLRSLQVLLPCTEETTDEALLALCARHPRLYSVFVHSAPEKRVHQHGDSAASVVYRPEVVDSAAHCGFVHPSYFVTNLRSFTEARSHNSCLNRKVSVDEHGEIRNCPAMPASYGNARATPLGAAVARPDFQSVWDVTKDQVEVCRDCEFRYVCTDCRAFVSDPADALSKPARCAYDPYTATWAAAPAPGQLAAAQAA